MAARKSGLNGNVPKAPIAGNELNINDMRSEIARLSELVTNPKSASTPTAELMRAISVLTEQLGALKLPAPLAEVPMTQEEVSAQIQAKILRALSTANNGKPGYMAMSEIEETFGLQKSAVHWHTNALEKAGKIWIRKTHDPKSGRPHFRAYHSAAIVEK